MELKFTKATRQQLYLRLGLVGGPGCGKTYTALRLAHSLTGGGGRIAYCDTEHGSARKYVGEQSPDGHRFQFDVVEMTAFSPENFTRLIRLAERERYDVVVLDSLSHAWMGKDGALDLVERAKLRNRGESQYFAWREVTPLHNELIETIVSSHIHVIGTMRAKVAYEIEEYVEDGRRKSRPVRIGLQPIQREGMEYEFDVVADLDQQHNLIVGKTRCPALAGKVFPQPGGELADVLKRWLSDGEEITPADRLRHEIRAAARANGWNGHFMLPLIKDVAKREATLDALTPDELNRVKGRMLDLKAEAEAEGGEF
jgi:DNA polymerase III delta prime subunit